MPMVPGPRGMLPQGYGTLPGSNIASILAAIASGQGPSGPTGTSSVRGQPIPWGNKDLMKATSPPPDPSNPETLFQALMDQASGNTQASTGGPTGPNPYNVAVRVLQHQYAQAGAQSQQNIADIGSWFGQYGTAAQHAVKSNRKAGKAAAKDAGKFSAGIIEGIADPNVARDIAKDAMSTQRYIGKSNATETRFDNRMVADASRQEAYYKNAEANRSALEQSQIRDQIAMAKAERASALAASGTGDEKFNNILSVLRLLPQDQRAQMLGFPGADQKGFDTDARSGLAAALSGASQLGTNPDTKAPSFGYQSFNDLLTGLQHGASAGGFDLNNPQIRDAYRQWIAANLLPLWNQYQGGPDYTLQGKSFLEKH